MLAGVALLGVWEGAKWMARKLWSDELQEAKIRKLARIREETRQRHLLQAHLRPKGVRLPRPHCR